MRLKTLTLIGFKSFADKITLDFDSEIIGIVGPNGCGKSNIVDAFRWVMGEQSAKSLRGEKMHDVLFSGTEKRKPLNYAEVSVSLSDIAGDLRVPYEEVLITRRLHRSGESEYFINRESVRLKDIHDLFLGSGLGKNAFSVFEQGKLDQIIHLSPIERRAIFDEAAGTSRFLLRKRESLKKLAAVNDNFTRVHDLHSEIEKQVKQLKKQATQAKSYQDNQSRLLFLEQGLLFKRHKEASRRREEIELKRSNVNHTFSEMQQQLLAMESTWDAAKKGLREEEIAYHETQQEYNLYVTKSKVLEAETIQLKHRIVENKKREESLKTHLHKFIQEKDLEAGSLEQKRALLHTQKVKEGERHALWREEKEKHTLLHKEVEALREKIKQTQASYLKYINEEKKQSEIIQALTVKHAISQTRLNTLQEQEREYKNTLHSIEEHIASQNKKVTLLTEQSLSFKGELEGFEKELQGVRSSYMEAQKKESELTRSLTETESFLTSLSRLQEELEGFSGGAKLVLKEAKQPKSPLYKKITPLFEHFIPLQGCEEMIATAMKPYADTLVVSDEEVFAQLLEFADKKKISDFSCLILSRIPSTESKKKGVPALNSLSAHFTNALQLDSQGNFYDALGVFFYRPSGKKGNNTFLRQTELKHLSERLQEIKGVLERHCVEREQLAARVQGVEKARNSASEMRQKGEMGLIQENFTLQRALADKEKINRALKAIDQEIASLQNLHEEGQLIEEGIAKEIELKNTLNEIAQRLHSEESLLDLKHQDLLQQSQALQSSELIWRESEKEWQEVQKQIHIAEATIAQSAMHRKKIEEEINDIGQLVRTAIEALEKGESELASVCLKQKGAHLLTAERGKSLSEAKRVCDMLEKELGQKRKHLTPLERELQTTEIALAQVVTEQRAIEQELKDRFRVTTEQGMQPQEEIPFSIDETLQEIGRLRSLLESTGAVNLRAIEEFQESQHRFDFLDQQLKDLQGAKEELEEIIAKLDQESRKIFKKTFLQIKEHFQKNFAILFNGGTADLTFTESSDILEAGIEIIAKPPGKQMRSISLLSGGEKCLTALALLFSIFEVKPAPFCILDEIDAPLDDTNIDRFTTVLKTFIDKTQFIIVTHNKKTMAIADLLIGVSMEEKGVSKLISLAFEKLDTYSPIKNGIGVA